MQLNIDSCTYCLNLRLLLIDLFSKIHHRFGNQAFLDFHFLKLKGGKHSLLDKPLVHIIKKK